MDEEYLVYCHMCGEECTYEQRSEDYGIYLCSEECGEALEEEIEILFPTMY